MKAPKVADDARTGRIPIVADAVKEDRSAGHQDPVSRHRASLSTPVPNVGCRVSTDHPEIMENPAQDGPVPPTWYRTAIPTAGVFCAAWPFDS
jgi:hypothetical protein